MPGLQHSQYAGIYDCTPQVVEAQPPHHPHLSQGGAHDLCHDVQFGSFGTRLLPCRVHVRQRLSQFPGGPAAGLGDAQVQQAPGGLIVGIIVRGVV